MSMRTRQPLSAPDASTRTMGSVEVMADPAGRPADKTYDGTVTVT